MGDVEQLRASHAVGTLPVVETFGPTVQGEGPLAGLPTYFVRLGYCDYRCSWCDSMYAVEPEQVAARAERLSASEIVGRISALDPGPSWVTLSGGNPAIHELTELVAALHAASLNVAVETQGSYWRPWLLNVDQLVVSPKPPSSGMATPERTELVHSFMEQAGALAREARAIKIVIFDEFDLAWARLFFGSWPEWPAYLSIGTEQPKGYGWLGLATTEARRQICEDLRALYEQVALDPAFAGVRVLPQLHVLAWGHARGV